MKPILTAMLLATCAGTAFAQGPEPTQPDCCDPAPAPPPPPPPEPAPAPAATPAPAPKVAAYVPESTDTAPLGGAVVDEGGGWERPAGRRFAHGFRLGWTYLYHMNDRNTRMDAAGNPISLGQKYGLKSPNMMLLGYEGFYRIIGHSWLNVLMVGNITIAGLEQSKFIPAASGLIGFEFDRSFQLGVGVNLTPDPDGPSHMIAAAGWTPQVGAIQTPLHFFFVPDTEGNHRMGATIGMTW